MNVEQSLEWELAGETEVLGENLSQFHFVHHKSHRKWPGLEPGPPQLEAWAMARPDTTVAYELALYAPFKRLFLATLPDFLRRHTVYYFVIPAALEIRESTHRPVSEPLHLVIRGSLDILSAYI
jgi:hypothetical protein